MTMMEAMSVGLPCISINTGGPRTLLSISNKSNYAIDINDYDTICSDIAHTLEELILKKNFNGSSNEELKKLLISEKYKVIKNIIRN